MSRIAEVAQPKEREQKLRVISDMGEYDPAGLEKLFQHQLRNAAAWLLAVTGQFQKGDAATLVDGISWLEGLLEVKEIRPGAEDQAKEIHRVTCCLRRMLEAAKIMEGEQ